MARGFHGVARVGAVPLWISGADVALLPGLPRVLSPLAPAGRGVWSLGQRAAVPPPAMGSGKGAAPNRAPGPRSLQRCRIPSAALRASPALPWRRQLPHAAIYSEGHFLFCCCKALQRSRGVAHQIPERQPCSQLLPSGLLLGPCQPMGCPGGCSGGDSASVALLKARPSPGQRGWEEECPCLCLGMVFLL